MSKFVMLAFLVGCGVEPPEASSERTLPEVDESLDATAQATLEVVCPAGQYWNGEACAFPWCPPGTFWNGIQCVKFGL